MRNAASFKRSGRTLQPQPRVLVLCEDTKSAKVYIEDARSHYHAQAEVEITHAGRTDPYGIVSAAVGRQKFYDRIYCVFDRDTHAKFAEAIHLARSYEKITLVRSYPCFEFWLLLHFAYSRQPFNSAGNESAADRVIRELKKKPGFNAYEKGNAAGYFELLLSRLSEARIYAARTLKDSDEVGEPNPSTEMHHLIEALELLSRPLPRN
jgi:hypothetical protein